MTRKTMRIRGGSRTGLKGGPAPKTYRKTARAPKTSGKPQISQLALTAISGRKVGSTTRPKQTISETSLVESVNHIFPKPILEKLKDLGINTVRSIYELMGAQQQCNNVIGKVRKGTDKCYLCGLGIYNSDPFLGLKPECEHVLPIAEAIYFLGLYDATKKKDVGKASPHTQSPILNVMSPQMKELLESSRAPTPNINSDNEYEDEEMMDFTATAPPGLTQQQSIASINNMTKKILKLEYRWAHRTCNQIKSDITFIATARNGAFVPNEKNIKDILNNIASNTREDGPFLKYLLYKRYPVRGHLDKTIDVKAFISDRLEKVKTIVQKICDHLNEQRARHADLIHIFGLINLEQIPQYNKKLQKILKENPDLGYNIFHNTNRDYQFEKDYTAIIESIHESLEKVAHTHSYYTPIINRITSTYKNKAHNISRNASDAQRQYVYAFIQYRLYELMEKEISETYPRDRMANIKKAINEISMRSGLTKDIATSMMELETA